MSWSKLEWSQTKLITFFLKNRLKRLNLDKLMRNCNENVKLSQNYSFFLLKVVCVCLCACVRSWAGVSCNAHRFKFWEILQKSFRFLVWLTRFVSCFCSSSFVNFQAFEIDLNRSKRWKMLKFSMSWKSFSNAKSFVRLKKKYFSSLIPVWLCW